MNNFAESYTSYSLTKSFKKIYISEKNEDKMEVLNEETDMDKLNLESEFKKIPYEFLEYLKFMISYFSYSDSPSLISKYSGEIFKFSDITLDKILKILKTFGEESNEYGKIVDIFFEYMRSNRIKIKQFVEHLEKIKFSSASIAIDKYLKNEEDVKEDIKKHFELMNKLESFNKNDNYIKDFVITDEILLLELPKTILDLIINEIYELSLTEYIAALFNIDYFKLGILFK